MFLESTLYSLFGQPKFCLNFKQKKKKKKKKKNDLQSGVSLKMPPSSLSMEEFDPEIQK